MHIKKLHSWDAAPKEAVEIQKQLRTMVATENSLEEGSVSFVAGCDVAYSKSLNKLYAIVAVFSYPRLELVEESHAVCEATLPYLPGLLVFREGPPLLQAFGKLGVEPDVIMFDGHGLAHPQEMGMASHMGIILDKPTIGVAKTVLCGNYQEPHKKKGDSSPLLRAGREIGRVLCTKSGVKPLFVSVGNKIDLETAERFVLSCCSEYRLPEPIRQAHLLSSKMRTSNQFSINASNKKT